jgi:hypothetical protein
LALRFAVDDLKAYALEAAIAGGARPSSRQLGDWLWNETATGAAIRTLRRLLADSPDDRAKLIATMFLVPALRADAGRLSPVAELLRPARLPAYSAGTGYSSPGATALGMRSQNSEMTAEASAHTASA